MSLVSASIAWYCLAGRRARAISSDGPMTFSTRSPSAMAMSLGSSAPLAGNSQSPRSSFLPTTSGCIGGAVEVLADLHLDQRALLLDHDDHLEAAREILDVLDVERPRAADLEQPDADLGWPVASSMPRSSSAWRTSR